MLFYAKVQVHYSSFSHITKLLNSPMPRNPLHKICTPVLYHKLAPVDCPKHYFFHTQAMNQLNVLVVPGIFLQKFPMLLHKQQTQVGGNPVEGVTNHH